MKTVKKTAATSTEVTLDVADTEATGADSTDQIPVDEPPLDGADVAPKSAVGEEIPTTDAASVPVSARIIGFAGRPDPLPEGAIGPFVALGQHLDADVYLLLHGRGAGPDTVQSITEFVYKQFRNFRSDMSGRRAVLVIDSPGGQASAAYKIARLFQQSADEFIVAIPRYAMSAGTLLSLGASEVHMGADSQIGPLDVQLHDREREEWSSALDEVQSLDQITAAAIAQADQAMFFLMQRSGKKLETLIPLAMDFAAKLQAPMVEKIDTIHYSQQSRILKVAQDYAERLLKHHRKPPEAQSVAQQLVHEYPEHGFVIDKLEARDLLPVSQDPVAAALLDQIGEFIDATEPIIFGKIEVEHEGNDQHATQASESKNEVG